MNRFTICLLLILGYVVLFALPVSARNITARITAFDPPPGNALAFYDKLYLQIAYDSDIPVRFQSIPLRNGSPLEYGAMSNTPSLQKVGKGVALVWVSFSNPTRIDEVSVTVFDTEWQKIDQIGITMDTVWNAPMREEPRPKPDWVERLERKEKLKLEFVFDPSPQKEETVYDAFFYLSAVTIPFFLFLQVQFLRRWRKRWRELAFIPILSITPMIVISLFGLGIEFRLWVIFIFRGMPLALIYLLVLWFAKTLSEKKMLGS